MSLRLQQRAQQMPAPAPSYYHYYCARTGAYIGPDPENEVTQCLISHEPLGDLLHPVQIGDAPHVADLGGLLQWRDTERRNPLGIPGMHRNPYTNLPYNVTDLRPVRYEGLHEGEYNATVDRLNELRVLHHERVPGSPLMVHMAERDAQHLLPMVSAGHDLLPPKWRAPELANAAARLLKEQGGRRSLTDVAALPRRATSLTDEARKALRDGLRPIHEEWVGESTDKQQHDAWRAAHPGLARAHDARRETLLIRERHRRMELAARAEAEGDRVARIQTDRLLRAAQLEEDAGPYTKMMEVGVEEAAPRVVGANGGRKRALHPPQTLRPSADLVAVRIRRAALEWDMVTGQLMPHLFEHGRLDKLRDAYDALYWEARGEVDPPIRARVRTPWYIKFDSEFSQMVDGGRETQLHRTLSGLVFKHRRALVDAGDDAHAAGVDATDAIAELKEAFKLETEDNAYYYRVTEDTLLLRILENRMLALTLGSGEDIDRARVRIGHMVRRERASAERDVILAVLTTNITDAAFQRLVGAEEAAYQLMRLPLQPNWETHLRWQECLWRSPIASLLLLKDGNGGGGPDATAIARTAEERWLSVGADSVLLRYLDFSLIV
jgi:hypothetical protein